MLYAIILNPILKIQQQITIVCAKLVHQTWFEFVIIYSLFNKRRKGHFPLFKPGPVPFLKNDRGVQESGIHFLTLVTFPVRPYFQNEKRGVLTEMDPKSTTMDLLEWILMVSSRATGTPSWTTLMKWTWRNLFLEAYIHTVLKNHLPSSKEP